MNEQQIKDAQTAPDVLCVKCGKSTVPGERGLVVDHGEKAHIDTYCLDCYAQYAKEKSIDLTPKPDLPATTYNIVNVPEGFECVQCKEVYKTAGDITPKCANPFSVFIYYKNNPPTIEDARIGGELAKEFFTLVGPDAEGLPDCVESVVIKRTV